MSNRLKFFKMASSIGVMLGVPDERISFEEDISNAWTTNKFGGVPNWMNKAPDVYPQCTLCGYLLPMVSQIYCPLENSAYHRVLYLFGCVNISCWNKSQSWKVLRCQLLVKDKEYKDEKQEVQNEETWCDDADDWGEGETLQEASTIAKLNDLEEQTRNLNLDEGLDNEHSSEDNNYMSGLTSQNCALDLPNMIYFVSYYINVLEESHFISKATELSWSEQRLLKEYAAREGLQDIDEMLNTGGEWSGEKYETGVAKHGDKIFHKFKKQLSLCPKQCLRYTWNGEPLPMTSQSLGAIPSCNSCGEKRVFELQLMPALVSLLKIANKGHKTTSLNENNDNTKKPDFLRSESIEFGTVFVYTCSQGCWSEAMFREEYVIVHSDPDQHLFKNA